MLKRLVLCGFLLDAVACMTSSHDITAAPAAQESAARLERSVANLDLTFFDSDTLTAYRASGPYRYLGESALGMEFEGRDELRSQPARITIFQGDGDGLWARMRVADQEFLTRLQ